jgi:hypothetical protein
LLALALVVSFGVDLSHTMSGAARLIFGIALLGARLLEHGIDPYHYIWHPGDPGRSFATRATILKMTVSKTTVTPALLVFYAPLAALPYRAAQFAWLGAQWLLLLGTAWLWVRNGATARQVWLTMFFVAGFTFTPGWRFELERGQCYVLLVFLLAAWLTMTRDVARTREFAAGFIAGLLVAFRPPYALLFPFLALHRRGQWAGAAVGLLLGFGVPMLLHPSTWLDYASAMQTNSDYYRHASLPPRPPQTFPATIEGTPLAIISSMVGYYPHTDMTVFSLARRSGVAPLPGAPFVIGFGVLFLAWLWWRRRQAVEWLLPGMAAWVFLSDYFLPTTRWGYYDVMVLNVIFAGIVVAKKFPWTIVPCLLALPVMWSFFAMDRVPIQLIYVSQALFVLSAILCLFWSGGREAKCEAPNSLRARL